MYYRSVNSGLFLQQKTSFLLHEMDNELYESSFYVLHHFGRQRCACAVERCLVAGSSYKYVRTCSNLAPHVDGE